MGKYSVIVKSIKSKSGLPSPMLESGVSIDMDSHIDNLTMPTELLDLSVALSGLKQLASIVDDNKLTPAVIAMANYNGEFTDILPTVAFDKAATESYTTAELQEISQSLSIAEEGLGDLFSSIVNGIAKRIKNLTDKSAETRSEVIKVIDNRLDTLKNAKSIDKLKFQNTKVDIIAYKDLSDLVTAFPKLVNSAFSIITRDAKVFAAAAEKLTKTGTIEDVDKYMQKYINAQVVPIFKKYLDIYTDGKSVTTNYHKQFLADHTTFGNAGFKSVDDVVSIMTTTKTVLSKFNEDKVSDTYIKASRDTWEAFRNNPKTLAYIRTMSQFAIMSIMRCIIRLTSCILYNIKMISLAATECVK